MVSHIDILKKSKRKYSLETKEGKSLQIYGYGVVDEERIKEKIIPLLEEKNIDTSVIICSYFSKRAGWKNGIPAISMTKRGEVWKPSKPKEGTKSCDWEISKDKKIKKIK